MAYSDDVSVTFSLYNSEDSKEGETTASPSNTHTVNIDDGIKQIQQTSPDADICAITLVDQPVRLCHPLSKDTESKVINQLEFAWGLGPGTLDLTNVRNGIVLSTNLFAAFTQGDWALVPSMETIVAAIRRTTKDQISDIWQLYTNLDSQEVYEYEFVHLKGTLGDITRRNPETGRLDTFRAPYEDFPLVRSHLHPYFVVCDVALKGSKHPSLEGELLRRVVRCGGLYNRWLSAKPRVRPPPIRRLNFEDSSASLSSASLSWSKLYKISAISCLSSPKRKRSDEDAASDSEDVPNAKRQRTITAESLDKLGKTQWGIEGWIEGIGDYGSPDSPCMPEDDTVYFTVEENGNECLLLDDGQDDA